MTLIGAGLIFYFAIAPALFALDFIVDVIDDQLPFVTIDLINNTLQ